jgi:hypothetical protein
MPGRQLSAGVARMRAECVAVSAAPSGERRAREPVPMPRMERRKRPLCSALVCPPGRSQCYDDLERRCSLRTASSEMVSSVLYFSGSLSSGRGSWSVVRRRIEKEGLPQLKAQKMCSCTFSPTLGRSIFGSTPILVSISGLPTPESSRICKSQNIGVLQHDAGFFFT